MNTREFFIQQLKAERPKFLSVIRALPDQQLHYKPHERNTAAGDIAWFLVLELRALVDAATTGDSHWKQPPRPLSAAEIATQYEKVAKELETAVQRLDDKEWERDARMFVGEKLVLSRPLGDLIWDFLFDAIHHRGQLTAYLRPMGGKIPSIYGPSGDAS